jgi:hypothetical protein
MLATIDGSDDQSLGVELPPVDLAAVGKLKEPLTHFHRRAVYLIEEEDNGLGASGHKPVRGVPGGSLAPVNVGVCRVGQTEKIALSHLRGSALYYRERTNRSGLIDHLGLADAMATAQKHGELGIEDVRNDREESCEIDSHESLQGGKSGGSSPSH